MGEAPAFFIEDLVKDSNGGDLASKCLQTITIIGDKTYMIGGPDDELTPSIGVKVYDRSTGKWLSPTVLGTKPKLGKGHSAVPLNQDRILVLKKNSTPNDCIWFLEVDTKFIREQESILGTEVVTWSKGVVGDTKKPIVISGPSGVGKGTLISKLMKEFPTMFGFSVSHTTRAPRAKEKDGVHYHFTEQSVMEEEIKNGRFLEFASVHGNLYGTSVEAVEVVADEGKRCILDIDVQGAGSVRVASLEAIFIFISPPSIQELEKRLSARGTETEEQIEKRVRNALAELEQAKSPGLFNHVLENDDLEKCYNNLKKLLGLEGNPATICKSSVEMIDLPSDYSVSRIGHKILISRGNGELERPSENLLALDLSCLKGGAPGRTRGLKLYSAGTFSDGTNGIAQSS